MSWPFASNVCSFLSPEDDLELSESDSDSDWALSTKSTRCSDPWMLTESAGCQLFGFSGSTPRGMSRWWQHKANCWWETLPSSFTAQLQKVVQSSLLCAISETSGPLYNMPVTDEQWSIARHSHPNCWDSSSLITVPLLLGVRYLTRCFPEQGHYRHSHATALV